MARSRSRALTKIWPIADRPNGCVVGVTLTPQVLGIGGYSNHQVRRQLIVQLQDAKPQAVHSSKSPEYGPTCIDWMTSPSDAEPRFAHGPLQRSQSLAACAITGHTVESRHRAVAGVRTGWIGGPVEAGILQRRSEHCRGRQSSWYQGVPEISRHRESFLTRNRSDSRFGACPRLFPS